MSSGPRSFCGDFDTNVSNFHDTRGISEDHMKVVDFGAFEETLIRTSEISMTPEEFLRIMSKSSTLNGKHFDMILRNSSGVMEISDVRIKVSSGARAYNSKSTTLVLTIQSRRL